MNNPKTIRHLFLATLVLVAALLALACSPATGPKVEFTELASVEVEATNDPAKDLTAVDGDSILKDSEDLASSLGFVVKRGETMGLRNGGRVPLGDDKITEVFISPYPPDWQTDLHLFLLNKETFEPVTDVDVDLIYDMVFMDHGIDGQVGTKLGEGHYVLPLSFLMYGVWQVDTTVYLPEGKKHLRFVVNFFP